MKRQLLGFLGIFLPLSFAMAQDSAGEKRVFQAIQGGKFPEEAVLVEFNRDYKLKQHLKKGEFEYFRISLEPNTILTLETRTFEKGLSWNGNRRMVTSEPFAGLQLLDGKKGVMDTIEIQGVPQKSEKISFRNRSEKTEEYFIRVGSEKGSIHKNHMTFKVTLAPFHYTDADSDLDAGSIEAAALPIQPSRSYAENSIGGQDEKDVFAFPGGKGEWYSLTARAIDPMDVPIRVEIWRLNNKGDKKPVVSYLSGGTEQIITESFRIPKNGLYYVGVVAEGVVNEKTLYSLELMPASGRQDKSVAGLELP